jgi:hypothetical protein
VLGKSWSLLWALQFWTRLPGRSPHVITSQMEDGRERHLTLNGPLAEGCFLVSSLKNDFYRDLAAEVERKGGFGKVRSVPFSEFRWAEYFRGEKVNWSTLIRDLVQQCTKP